MECLGYVVMLTAREVIVSPLCTAIHVLLLSLERTSLMVNVRVLSLEVLNCPAGLNPQSKPGLCRPRHPPLVHSHQPALKGHLALQHEAEHRGKQDQHNDGLGLKKPG